MKILLVADHSSAAAQGRSAVDGLPQVDVLHVSTPKRALALIDEGEVYDIVVADNDTHPTGGFALCREVKARGQMGRDVPPVVLLLARPQDIWLSNWAQADAYALKPADPFDLRETIESLVAGSPVPELPGIGGEPTPSLLDPSPAHELAVATHSAGRSDEGLPDQLTADTT
ncbi:hypothetical protein BH23ACT9_BH23ACT9_22800 [soil metagenome]